MTVDKSRAQRILEVGTVREMEDDVWRDDPQAFMISGQQLAHILKVRFTHDQRSVEALVNAMGGTKSGLIISTPYVAPFEFELNPAALQEIAEGKVFAVRDI